MSSSPPSSSGRKSKWTNENEQSEIDRLPPAKRRVITASRSRSTVAPELVGRSPAQQPSSATSARSTFVPIRTAHPPLLPSRSVYCYEKLNQIEEGSYGVVFRARDRQTGEIVALKKLKLDEEKQGFPITSLREINALMTCRHENVVGIREVVVGDTLTQSVVLRNTVTRPLTFCFINRIFIVMDFIEHDLKTLLTLMPSPFLQSEIKTLLSQLLSAVAHCHKNWILHRDLKTSNLLMNNRGTIKVADFGLARRFGDPVGVGGLTQLVVTLWYR